MTHQIHLDGLETFCMTTSQTRQRKKYELISLKYVLIN